VKTANTKVSFVKLRLS